MATVADHFLNKFQTIEGTTIAVRKKNFFKLLQEIAPLVKDNVEALDAITLNLNPRTYLESLFRVDFLIYFRRSQELLDLLKEGNNVFVSKVAKQVWFFEEVLGDVPANQLVNEILPCMSFSVRMKVLRKLSRFSQSEKFDEIFDALVTRYGIYLASQFITGCGPYKIRQIFTDYPVKLTIKQLKILYSKDPQLIDFYFTATNTSVYRCEYSKLRKFIYDRTWFENLNDRDEICIQLGRRATKKFVMLKKDEIIKNPYQFNYLDMRTVLRKIGRDSVQLFRNALPEQIPKYLINSDWLFRSFPKKYHYSLFIKTFQDHYKIKLADHPAVISEQLLIIIPDNIERAALAKVLVDTGDNEYLKYLPIEDSVRLIKEIINVTSDAKERGKLIKCLTETCHINNNMQALFEVMKYFCFKHKNDELNVHSEFIISIENLFDLKKFTEEMWATLNELVAIHNLKFIEYQSTCEKMQTVPLDSVNLATSVHHKLPYLEFLFKKGDVIDKSIREYFSVIGAFPEYNHYDKNFEKYFLLFVINNMTHNDTIYFNYIVICEINRWNNAYKDDQLSFYDFPVLLYTFNHIITNYGLSVYPTVFRAFRNKIFTTEENIYRNEYMQIYWERYDAVAKWTDIHWFLKYEPATIMTNFEIIFKMFTKKSNLHFWRQIKKFTHLDFDQESIQLSLAMLNDEKSIEMKPNFVPSLSVLMKPGDYVALADSYKPENKKLDLQNEQEIRRYKLQCAIAMHFKNTKSYEVLPSLLNYCAGDYFKYAMRSLYSLLYRTPENELPQYLNYLANKAVSVRKHALYMTCELTTSSKVEHMLRLLSKQEEVQSLQKYMFLSTIQYFVKNPSDSIFDLVKLNMLFITQADEESLNGMIEHLRKMPQNFKGQYVLCAWNHLEKTVTVWQKLRPLKEKLLGCVNSEIAKEIPLEVGMQIIQQHFMTEKESRYLNNIHSFMFIFLSSQDEKKFILDKILSIVDQCNSKEQTFAFFRSWYHQIMKSTIKNLLYMDKFVDYFEDKCSQVEDFTDLIKTYFLYRKLEKSEWTVEEFSEKLVSYYTDVFLQCGAHVNRFFAEEMDFNLSFFAINGVTKNDFYLSMLRRSPTHLIAGMLIEVVSEPSPYLCSNPATSKTFNEILHIFKAVKDPGLQICLQYKNFSWYQRYSKDMETDEDSLNTVNNSHCTRLLRTPQNRRGRGGHRCRRGRR
ncbi:hypothetical protein Zmor_010424 [Zophobas morio]|uniref:Uncharacterized protein n=1 Tax=Zophobas morio TaxID=2755281 RepID=A0AA38IPG8_9CUCU|nr:hypothetical protein Zmor_010424 [Zophobas morio]